MPTDAFRLSTYLTLAVACACLGYAEAPLLPEVGAFAAVVIVGLAVIYRVETRVELLSIPGANKLGAGIGLAGLLWGAFRVVRELQTGTFAALGWPVFVVALTGPVLILAVAAKLLRREKHAGDYWQIHLAGLGAVVLGGAMAEDAVAFALIAAYAACAVWSLAAFFLARASGAVPQVPGRTPVVSPEAPPARPVGAGPPGRGSGFPRAALWTAVAAAAAAPLYLLTPRSALGKLEFGKPRVEIGYAADQMVNLNQTGNLEPNPEPAFEVTAEEDDGSPKDDLSPGQRWRGKILSEYSRGSWRGGDAKLPAIRRPADRVGPWAPPNLGPGRYRLEYAVPTKLRSLFLADPVVWVPGQPAPVVSLAADGRTVPWLPMGDGSFYPIPSLTTPGPTVRYAQYTRRPADPDLGPGFELARGVDYGGDQRGLVNNPVPRVKEYADRLVEQMARDGALPRDFRDPVRLLPREEHHEAIARAFAQHLSDAPDLTYTTRLRRENKNLDPVEDFLFHARVGHCERFASALVLMLRSQGIPALFVLGFKGCEPLGGGGYVVRHEHAHAWAEALISRPGPGGPGAVARPGGPFNRDGRVWHWLSLDPSPPAEVFATASGPEGWLGRAAAFGRTVFRDYLVNYTPEHRERALKALGRAATSPEGLAGVAAVVGVVFGVRWARRRAARPRPAPPPETARWFDQLLGLLAAHGYAPGPGETPREFTGTVADALRRRPATAAVADVPPAWAEAYYQARFGGVPVPDDRRAELEARLADLRRALAA